MTSSFSKFQYGRREEVMDLVRWEMEKRHSPENSGKGEDCFREKLG